MSLSVGQLASAGLIQRLTGLFLKYCHICHKETDFFSSIVYDSHESREYFKKDFIEKFEKLRELQRKKVCNFT